MAAELRTRTATNLNGETMKTVYAQRDERKSSGNGFESIGSIMKRLRAEKGELEARMPRWFDLRHSLKLDQVVVTIEALTSGGAAW